MVAHTLPYPYWICDNCGEENSHPNDHCWHCDKKRTTEPMKERSRE